MFIWASRPSFIEMFLIFIGNVFTQFLGTKSFCINIKAPIIFGSKKFFVLILRPQPFLGPKNCLRMPLMKIRNISTKKEFWARKAQTKILGPQH